MGGRQSVRGYRQNIRSGNNGFRVAIKDRITVQRNESDYPRFNSHHFSTWEPSGISLIVPIRYPIKLFCWGQA
ncbi:hypothetical protein [Nostoc sp.]|uniref:hypothetical protein n=1 Tax=Nostoc sp. TaxID=1180 RepID=UPI002FF80820